MKRLMIAAMLLALILPASVSAQVDRATLSGLDSAAQLLCGAVLGAGGTSEQCAEALQPLLGLLGLDDLGSAQ